MKKATKAGTIVLARKADEYVSTAFQYLLDAEKELVALEQLFAKANNDVTIRDIVRDVARTANLTVKSIRQIRRENLAVITGKIDKLSELKET